MSVEIKPSEIDRVDQIGNLDGSEVKMVRTKGGLYLAVGRPRGRGKDEVLAAGSHPAIVKYNIEKSYSSYQPTLMKSEDAIHQEFVVGMTNFLDQKLIDSGYDLYSIKKNNEIDFVLTKSNVEVLSYKAESVDNDIIIGKANKVITKEFSSVPSAVVKAVATVASYEDKTIIHGNKRYDPKSIISNK